MSVGEIIGKFLSPNLSNLLGSGALLGIGIWGIWETFKAEKQEIRNQRHHNPDDLAYNTFIEQPEIADVDNSKFIDVRESITLAFALTINNLAGGIGAGISGLDVPLTTFATFIFSVLSIIGGYFIGKKFTAKMSGKYAGILSACLIICIAIYEYFNK
jgi:putative sporulation protein YtaF